MIIGQNFKFPLSSCTVKLKGYNWVISQFILNFLILYLKLNDKLQRPQNRAARILMSANSYCNVGDLFLALGWRKLKHQRQVSTAIMMYKTVHGMTPDHLTSKFVSRDEITSYRLRNTENKLVLPLPRTNYLKKSFSYSGAKLWNSLSHDLRSADSLHDFKRKLCRNSFE